MYIIICLCYACQTWIFDKYIPVKKFKNMSKVNRGKYN